MNLDDLDRKAASAFDGFIVRKDLVRTFSRQFPVPTYVVEFLLGRYCATTDEAEIQEGLEIVQRQLQSRTVKAGEEELFKARARETGSVKIIDIITARLDAKSDSYVASLPSLRLNDVRISPELIKEHERMLTGGSTRKSRSATTQRLPRKRAVGRLVSMPCVRFSCPSGMCWPLWLRGASN
jgi:ATP-dependent Lon protease